MSWAGVHWVDQAMVRSGISRAKEGSCQHERRDTWALGIKKFDTYLVTILSCLHYPTITPSTTNQSPYYPTCRQRPRSSNPQAQTKSTQRKRQRYIISNNIKLLLPTDFHPGLSSSCISSRPSSTIHPSIHPFFNINNNHRTALRLYHDTEQTHNKTKAQLR